MEQQSGNQFDDDLTVGTDDDSYSSDSIDLFEFTGDEGSPIAKLKTIILSIDWEINDDILKQLDDELIDLADIWAGDKIKLVYVQGLSKIGKYIFKEKANAHPNAIKLLITFYHNLEKIVASEDSMNDEEKKQLLFKDVKSFDQLKQQIGMSSSSSSFNETPPEETIQTDEANYLKSLKAYVLGLDWEINDAELQKLDDEVIRLQGVFSQNKAQLILLQGIGALSSYINKMRSQSNSKAFTLMHSFYGTLEAITETDLPAEEEKQLLLSEVEKFNRFKADIATSKPEPADDVKEPKVASDFSKPATVATTAAVAAAVTSTAFSTNTEEIDGDEEQVASDVESRLDAVFGEDEEEAPSFADANSALEGVNVESEADDDSDEDALPYHGDTVAPALSEADEESSFSVEKLASDLAQSAGEEDQGESTSESSAVLQGVDVESEADDDSDEDTLPFEDGDLAPALTGSSADSGFDEDILSEDLEDSATEDLESRLDSFFDEDIQDSIESIPADQEDTILESDSEDSGFIAALSDDADGIEEPVVDAFESDDKQSLFDQEPAPALSDVQSPAMDEEALEDAIEEKLSFFDEEPEEPATDVSMEKVDAESAIEETAVEDLAFLDDDVPAPALEEMEESFSPAEDEVELDEEDLSFFDDEPAPALSVDDELAAVDDDFEEDTLSLQNEETDIPVLDETEDFGVKEETIEEQIDDELEIFDDDTSELEFDLLDTDIDTDSADVEDLAESENIEFTVPGEVGAAAVVGAAVAGTLGSKESEPEDIIEFMVPGEDELSEIPSDAVEELDTEEVVFEAVDDDVEVDPLPGEEFADSPSTELVSDTSTHENLGNAIVSLRENISDSNLQNVFAEINKSRNLNPSNAVGKIFLQLLSTTCQHVERNMDDSDTSSLALIDEVYSGFNMSISPDTPTEQIHQQILTCTSKVLLLQQNDINCS